MNQMLENSMNMLMWVIIALLAVSSLSLLTSIMVYLAKRLLTIWGLLFLVTWGAFLYSHHSGLIHTPVEYLKWIQNTL